MKHLHHIKPKHMGGTDDPSNLIELTVEEHAEAHRKLFEEYGCWQDEIAWKGLAGIIGKEEIIRKIQSEAGKERMRLLSNPSKGFNFNEEFRKHVSALGNNPDAIAKKKKTMAEKKHQQGSKNSQYGSKWCVKINDEDLSGRKKFKNIPGGWITTTEWKELRKDKSNNAYGTMWINNGKENKLIHKNKSVPNNWKRGRIMDMVVRS
jgi:hypothetical protein